MKKMHTFYLTEIEEEFLRTVAYEQRVSQTQVVEFLLNYLMDHPEIVKELKRRAN